MRVRTCAVALRLARDVTARAPRPQVVRLWPQFVGAVQQLKLLLEDGTATSLKTPALFVGAVGSLGPPGAKADGSAEAAPTAKPVLGALDRARAHAPSSTVQRTGRCGGAQGHGRTLQRPSWSRGDGPRDHRLLVKLLCQTLCHRICSLLCGPGVHDRNLSVPILLDAIHVHSFICVLLANSSAPVLSQSSVYICTLWISSDNQQQQQHCIDCLLMVPVGSTSSDSAFEVVTIVSLLHFQFIKFPSTNTTLPPCEAELVG